MRARLVLIGLSVALDFGADTRENRLKRRQLSEEFIGKIRRRGAGGIEVVSQADPLPACALEKGFSTIRG